MMTHDFVAYAKAADKRHSDASEKLAKTTENYGKTLPIKR